MSSLGKRNVPPNNNSLNNNKRQCIQNIAIESSNLCKKAINNMILFIDKLESYKLSKNSELEVEVRLGSIMGKSFRSGVTKEFFYNYINILNNLNDYSCIQSDEIDYKIDSISYNRLTDTNGILTAMNKIKLHDPVNISNRFRYDCRISSAKETTIIDDIPDSIPDNWLSKRRKERRAFSSNNNYWVIHLTQVTSLNREQGNSIEQISYEVEFELKDTKSLNDKEYRKNVIYMLWNYLLDIFGGVIDKLEMYLDDVPSNELKFLQDTCWKAVKPDSPDHNQGFPGSMPVSFSRRYLKQLQQSDYYISEKTDGIRYMLLIYPGAVFMIGRKFDFNKLSNFNELCQLAPKGATILDGELVETLPRNPNEKPILTYMIFDVIQFNDKSVVHLKLDQRLYYIGQVVKWYREQYLRHCHGIPKAPFTIIGKRFVKKKDIHMLKSLIIKENSNRIYKDEKRNHKTDGFILTPNECYSPKGVANLYKWKYSDLLSIDFRILPSKGKLLLACANSGDNLIYCRNMELLEDDEATVKDILESKRQLCNFSPDPYYTWLHKDEGTVILEMTYDPEVGMWRFHVERTDKDSPNHITVVFDTMEAIAENITEKEFFYRVPKSTEEDDWKTNNQ